MPDFVRYALQVVFYALFMAVVGLLSDSPSYIYLEPHHGEIRISFRHAGQPVSPCHDRTAEEMQQLAPNMRKAKVCPRERSPLLLALEVDGREVFARSYPPNGLKKDGAAFVFAKIPLVAGEHDLRIRLRDSVAEPGRVFIAEQHVDFKAGQGMIISFNFEDKSFRFQ